MEMLVYPGRNKIISFLPPSFKFFWSLNFCRC